MKSRIKSTRAMRKASFLLQSCCLLICCSSFCPQQSVIFEARQFSKVVVPKTSLFLSVEPSKQPYIGGACLDDRIAEIEEMGGGK